MGDNTECPTQNALANDGTLWERGLVGRYNKEHERWVEIWGDWTEKETYKECGEFFELPQPPDPCA